MTPALDHRGIFQPADLLRFGARHLGFFRPFLGWRLAAVLAVVPLPLLIQHVIDHGVEAGSLRKVLEFLALGLSLLGIHVLCMRRAIDLLSERTQSLLSALRARIFDKLQFMHFGFLDSTQLGRMLSKYAFDTTNVETCVIMGIHNFLPEAVRSILMIALLGWMEPWLLAFIVVVIPVFAVIRLKFFSPIEVSNRRVRLARERLTGRANEFISAIKLIRGFGQESHATSAMEAVSSRYADSRRGQMEVNQTMGFVIFSLYTGIEILAVAFGGTMVALGQLTIGTLLALVGALPVILNPINLFSQVSAQFFIGRESYRSIKELIDSGYVEKWRGRRTLEPLAGEIAFEGVDFRYSDDGPLILAGIDLVIPAGQRIALVGPSGSGKSSLVNLVLGLYSPLTGVIRIDGVPQAELDIRAFRRQCAIVMQDSLLLSGSLRENLKFARPQAGEQEVVAAAKAANAWQFIEQLPRGLDTLVGERGVSLSGGQRQRIAIARALLRDPRVLILDEATSALDYESEAQVQDALERASRGRTTITIAHRLSTIRTADRIVVLRRGRIVEDGSFDDLAGREGGVFRELLVAHRGGS